MGNQFRSLNTRIDAGVGYAYGNSSIMPFIKEFFAGGVSDMRGFRARTLGPGTYHLIIHQKIHLLLISPVMLNCLVMFEYRAKLFSIVRYALFADAGNIWTLKEDTIKTGFKIYKQFFKPACC